MGRDDTGLGLGSTRAEVEAVLTSEGTDANGIDIYDCNGCFFIADCCVAVTYTDVNGSCPERATSFILDLIVP